ncbi:putative P6 protein [Cytorhabdovirus fragariarugosus]|nr:putative P6 protein [Cytorhabdovirus fragariarugosus]
MMDGTVQVLKDVGENEINFDIPGLNVRDKKDLIIMVMLITKVALITILFILCKTRRGRPGRLMMRWI